MHIHDHVKSTLLKIGETQEELHEALDENYLEFKSSLHWVILHHRLGIEKMVERFGEKVRRAAEIHIEDDMGFVPDGPTDPRLIKQVYIQGAWELDKAEKILFEIFGHRFGLKEVVGRIE